ncbi:MAG TPA: VOC family protein [Thermodesulfovibrionales bacterium]|nr:VOC family protein [Thermodesulfovibrionales bacterium]
MKYTGINHLAMATGDMDKTIRFWRDLLGMRLIVGLGKPGYRHYFFEISENDLIAFFEWPKVEPVPEKEHGYPVAGPVVFDHVSFGLETEDALWELKDRLDAAGFWVSEIIDHGFIHSLYSYDPNGIPIEFSHPAEGVNVRNDPTMADSAPSLISREGPEPHPEEWPNVERPTPRSEGKTYPGVGSELFHGIEKT